MTLDLAQFTEQLKDQLADLSKQRAEIQKELEAVQLILRATQRADPLPLKQEQEAPLPTLEQAPAVPETPPIVQQETPAIKEIQTDEDTTQPAPLVVEEESTQPAPSVVEQESAQPARLVVEEESTQPAPLVVEEESAQPAPLVVEETSAQPAPLVVEEKSAQPAPLAVEEIVTESVESAPEEGTEPVPSGVDQEVAVAEEPAQPEETSPENTSQREVRRTQLEETVMGLELNDEVAVLELLKMFQKPLSPGKIAEELTAVHWNFQGQHPRAAVNAALQKMVNEGRVTQVNGGDYSLSA
jgi:hypothetical protein